MITAEIWLWQLDIASERRLKGLNVHSPSLAAPADVILIPKMSTRTGKTGEVSISRKTTSSRCVPSVTGIRIVLRPLRIQSSPATLRISSR